MKTPPAVALGVALVVYLALLSTASQAVEVALFVERDQVNLRTGPGQDYPVVCALPHGTELRVKTQQGQWRQVYVPAANVTGWVAHWLLAETPEAGVRREVKYVAADDVNLREGPGERYNRIGVLPRGEAVDVIAYEGQWRKIRVPSNGEVGWVADWLLTGGSNAGPAPAPGPASVPTQTRYVRVEGLCLRSGPGSDYGAITTLAAGTPVQVAQFGQDWCKVTTANGLTGYVARDFLADSIRTGGMSVSEPAQSSTPFPSAIPAMMGQGQAAPSGVAPQTLQGGFQAVAPAGTNAGTRDPRSITASRVTVPAVPLRADGWVSDGLVNVRSGPGMGFNLVGQATQGTHVVIVGATNGWFLTNFDAGVQGWVAGWLVRTDPSVARQAGVMAPQKTPTDVGNSIARYALQFVGSPYVFGGMSPSGFDCSGLVAFTLKAHNIRIPRTSFDQWKVGTPVAPEQLIPGDLVFFANTYTAGVSHVGIYVGEGKFVHAASTGVGVIVQPLSERAGSYCGARRAY